MDDFRQTKAIAVHPEGRGAQVGEMRAPRKASRTSLPPGHR
jgi:hypothetical protein